MTDSIYPHIVKVQAKLTEIAKSHTAKVKGLNAQGVPYEYSFAYADLSDIMPIIRPILAAEGLGVIHQMAEGVLNTRIIHEDGEYIQTSTVMPTFSDEQRMGTWLTYLRRYHITGLLALATDADADGTTLSDLDDASPAKVSEETAEWFAKLKEQYEIKDDFIPFIAEDENIMSVDDLPLRYEQRLRAGVAKIIKQRKAEGGQRSEG